MDLEWTLGRAAWKAEGFIRIIDLVRQAAHHREALADRLAREKEAAEGTVAVRVQGQGGGQEVMSIDDFAARVRSEVAEQMGEY